MPPKPRLDNVVFEDANVVWRNFSGIAKPFNDPGDRNFCIILDPEKAASMKAEGWNVKETKVREEGDEPKLYLPVTVRYDFRPPVITLIKKNGTVREELPEENIFMLDVVDVKNWDVILNPSAWDVNGKTGIKAYLKKAFVTIDEDILDQKYADLEVVGQDPRTDLVTTVSEEE